MKFLLFLLLSSSILVITSLTPIYALLSFVFFISLTIPFFFVLLNFEYFAFLFLIIYLGAIIILFLFVVISLDGRVRQDQDEVPLLSFCIAFIIYIFLDILSDSSFENTLLCIADPLQEIIINVWPYQDIDFYAYSYNELGYLIIIAAIVLILALMCVIVIGDFIKKL